MKKTLLRWSGVALAFGLLLGTSPITAQTVFTIGDSVGVNTNTTYPSPFGDWYKTNRSQFLYHADELSAMGMGAGDITELAWYCNAPVIATDIPGLTENYEIKMTMTATTDLGAAWESGATTVWGPMNYTATTSAMNTFVLDVPFAWDGVSNVLIEICGGDNLGTYTDNGVVAYALMGYNASRTYRTDGATVGGICDYVGATSFGTNPTWRPVTYFTAGTADECTGIPEAGEASSTADAVCGGESFTVSIAPTVGVSGISYQWESSTDGVIYSEIVGATSASYTGTQTEATYYQCVVTCAGSGESGYSTTAWVDQNAATDCYCEPTFTSILSGDYVDDFTLAGISNLNSGESATNYNDYTDTYSTDLTIGVAYDVTVDCGPTWDQGIGVWIDMNVDGSFSADERLGCTLVDAGTGGSTYSITVPVGTTPGTTRMRVMSKYADDCSSLMDDVAACDATASFGETEDYTVTLVADDDCPGVTGVSASYDGSSATLSWDDAGATKYRWAVSNSSAVSVGHGQTFDLSKTISGLVAGETYTARVARDCYPDGWSAVNIYEFTMPLRLGQVGTEVSIYPNPSNGVFRIQLNGYSGSSMDLQIVNMVGQVVYHNMINVMDDVTAEEIDLSNVPAGTYMVRLTNGEEVSLQTIVIE